MNRDQAERFAEEWVAAWNRRDVPAVLAHYARNCEFRSPKAAAITGKSVVRGYEALAAYWNAAVAKITSIEFTLDRALWDHARRELCVIYEAKLGDRRNRACEVMRFGPDGKIISGEALYGIDL